MALTVGCSSSRFLGTTSRQNRQRAVRSTRCPLRVNSLFGGGQGGNNPFDMGKLMESVKKAQTLVQEETARVQKELASTEFEGFDDDETVRVVLSGNQEPRSVDVTDSAMELGADELSRRLTQAMKDAHGKSVAGMKDKMKELAGKLGLPNPQALGGGL